MNILLLFMAWMPILIGSIGIGFISYYFYKWAKGIRLVRYRLAGEICFVLVLLYFVIFFLSAVFVYSHHAKRRICAAWELCDIPAYTDGQSSWCFQNPCFQQYL